MTEGNPFTGHHAACRDTTKQAASRLTGHPVPLALTPSVAKDQLLQRQAACPTLSRQFGLVVKLFYVAEAKPGHGNNAFGQAKDLA
jgi:hypothetical protein